MILFPTEFDMSEEPIGTKILQQMLETGPLFGWDWVDKKTIQELRLASRHLVVGVTGLAEVGDKMVPLMICLTKNFPNEIPIIYLVNPNFLGLLPHVDHEGFVCYMAEEGLVPNHRDPERIIRVAFKKAVKVLEDGANGENHTDYINDLEYFWKKYEGAVESINSLMSPGLEPKRIHMIKNVNNQLFIAEARSAISKYENEEVNNTKENLSVIYLPLRSNCTFQLPEYGTFWTHDQARKNILDNITPETEKFLEKIKRKKRFKSTEIVTLGVPRPAGGTAIVGIMFNGVTAHHPLSVQSMLGKPIPLTFNRLDREFLLPRAGANLDLADKKIALVGCGSVGGYIAPSLIKAGIRNLTLIDGEKLKPENIFRHVLGRLGLDMYKSNTLKKELKLKFPYTKVKSITSTIQEAIDSRKFKWNSYDLVIVAVGKPTIELHLNGVAVRLPDTPPVLFTWLEPYDIGGHSIMVNNGESSGCLECLFTPTTDHHPLVGNKIHFSQPGQHFGKDITGCGQLFTPYGSLSALRTAGMATRMAIDLLTGYIDRNPLMSWKGDSRAFQEAGFRLTDNHQKSHDELLSPSYDYAVDHCPTCGSEPEEGLTT